MEMIIMTNAQMSSSCFKRGGNFTCSCRLKQYSSSRWLPNFVFPLNVKSGKKIRVSDLRIMAMSKEDANSSTSGLLQQEFEFKPSFDNYLKDMESVKSGRGKKQEYKSNENKWKEDSKRSDTKSLQRGEMNENLKRFKGYANIKKQEYKSNGNKWKDDSKRIDTESLQRGERKEKLKRFKGCTDIIKQEYKSNVTKWKGDSKRTDRESLQRGETNEKLKRFKGYSGTKKVSRVMEGNEIREYGNRASLQESVVNQVVKYKEKGVGVSRGKWSRNSGRDVNAKKKLGGMTRNGRWLKNQTSTTTPKLIEFTVDKKKKKMSAQEDSFTVDDVKSGGSAAATETMNPYREIFQEVLEMNRNTFEGGVGERENKTSSRYESNSILGDKNTDEELVHKNGLTRGSLVFIEDGVDDDFEEERAAFKSFEDINDVNGKLRTSKREMEARIQRLAKCLSDAEIHMPEWIFSKMIRSARIKFTDHSISRIIQILGKLGNWRRVLQVIEWLQMRERFKSHRLRNVYTTALYALGKAKRPVEALNVFHAMLEEMSTYPDKVAYHCIAVTLGQAGYIRELFDVIDCMRSPPKKKFETGVLGKWDPRLEPDIVVYNAVLNACVRRKQLEGAFWVLQQLEEKGQQPSASTYGLVMEVMFACGKYNLVHEFFQKMQRSFIPDALSYKVIVNTFWKEGKTDEAVLAIEQMERQGIVGSAALYYDLARCLCSAGRCQEALAQIEKICKVASKPLVVTYTGLIQACLDSGNIQNAAYIFNEMKRFCTPNIVTCNIMLKAYVQNGLFEEANKLFHNMIEDGNQISHKSHYKFRVIPDVYSFNTMLDASVAEKRWNDFEYIYVRMLHHGYHFNAKCHLQMLLEASRAGKREPLEITCNHLVQSGQVPPPPLIRERFCIMLEKEDYDAALICISVNPTGKLWAFSKMNWLKLLKENSQRISKTTLLHLMHKLSMLVAGTDSVNPVLQNLVAACNDFIMTGTELPEVNPAEIVHTVQIETSSDLNEVNLSREFS